MDPDSEEGFHDSGALAAGAGSDLGSLALILSVRRRWRCGGFEGRALVLLVALSLAIRLLGADYEVEERAYRDEGTYYHHAQEINQGKVLRFSFVYPHLTYNLDAFTLWLADLYPRAWAAATATVYGVTEPLAREWTAICGAKRASCALPCQGSGFRFPRLSPPERSASSWRAQAREP